MIEEGKGWFVFDEPDGPHIVPRNDLITHEISQDCVCGPETIPVLHDDGTVSFMYTHHSLDDREKDEPAL